MNKFPEHIKADNINKFPEINNQRVLSIFRQEIYEMLLTRKDENEYVDLDNFSRKYCKNKTCILNKIVEQVIYELHGLGWKTDTSFGSTGLFIYSTEEKPRSCW